MQSIFSSNPPQENQGVATRAVASCQYPEMYIAAQPLAVKFRKVLFKKHLLRTQGRPVKDCT
jgi:hypothetical protein